MTTAPRGRGDAGHSMLTASLGLLIFLSFLLFAVQLLLNLFETSTVTVTAQEGARLVASSRVDHSDPTEMITAERHAEDKMRALLGPQGATARFDWSSTGDQVVLRVQLDTPRFTAPAFGGRLPYNHIDRTVRVRVEDLR